MNKMAIISKYKQAVVEMFRQFYDSQKYGNIPERDRRFYSIRDAVNEKYPGLITYNTWVIYHVTRKIKLFFELSDGFKGEYEFKF